MNGFWCSASLLYLFTYKLVFFTLSYCAWYHYGGELLVQRCSRHELLHKLFVSPFCNRVVWVKFFKSGSLGSPRPASYPLSLPWEKASRFRQLAIWERKLHACLTLSPEATPNPRQKKKPVYKSVPFCNHKKSEFRNLSWNVWQIAKTVDRVLSH